MKRAFSIVGAAALWGAGCGSDGGSSGQTTAQLAEQAASAYARIAYQAYSDSLSAAEALDASLTELVANPSIATQQAAKAAWLAAREPYLQTEVYRFYDGPIDNPIDGPEGEINAWPMDEAHVDYTRDDPDSGIINDPAVVLDAGTLRGKNEEAGEENIAVGFHPIEFLLWGQDDPDTSTQLPGQRPYTDYVTDGAGTAANQSRRGQYLDLLGDLLTEDLQRVVDAWDPDDSTSFRAEFVDGPWQDALEKMLTGMIILSGFETGGERLQVALDNGDQEDEHSCFSDNTHRDMVQNVRGIQNVWLGRYQAIDPSDSISGVGISEVIASREPELAGQITEQIARSLSLAEALRPTDEDPPFDVLISLGNQEGNAKVQALIDSLHTQEDLLSQAFLAFELTVPEPG